MKILKPQPQDKHIDVYEFCFQRVAIADLKLSLGLQDKVLYWEIDERCTRMISPANQYCESVAKPLN